MSREPGAVAWPALVPEEPIQVGPLAVYPLFNPVPAPAEPGYVLLDKALGEGLAEVTEVSEGGHVPIIALINKGHLPILALQGQELVGAKQNRTLNVSLLAPAGRTEIPVTCVERGRWAYRGSGPRSEHQRSGRRSDCQRSGPHGESTGLGRRGGQFKPSTGAEHYELRRMKAEMVYEAYKRAPRKKRGYDVDQMAVWREVDRAGARHEVRSATAALNDVYEAPNVASRMRDFEKLNDLPEGTIGVAVALGGELAGAEFMESAEAFAAVWPTLQKGYALSALHRKDEDVPSRMQAQTFVSWPLASSPEVGETIALGEDVRWEGRGFLAAALVHEGRMLHGTLFVRRADAPR